MSCRQLLQEHAHGISLGTNLRVLVQPLPPSQSSAADAAHCARGDLKTCATIGPRSVCLPDTECNAADPLQQALLLGWTAADACKCWVQPVVARRCATSKDNSDRGNAHVPISLLQVLRLLGSCFQQPLRSREDESALGSMANTVLLPVPRCNHIERTEAYVSRGGPGPPRTWDPLCSSTPS